ncbi:MAG: DNA methyltransferase [Proteobacteria bacterium]|nr:DNA methyltransferase [Pseudomonadota bacterium]
MHAAREQLRQRADYTYKFNAGTGRHGWLRLTPAYSVKIVEEIVTRYGASLNILDPFCGTGTTALSAVNHGHDAATTDINPFLIWLARAKTAHYAPASIGGASRAGAAALDLALQEAVVPAAEPPIHKIERWWPAGARRFLCHLKAAISDTAGSSSEVADLLKIAFCRSVIRLSNAAFNHQSMSFKDDSQGAFDLGPEAGAGFLEDLRHVLAGAAQNPAGNAVVTLGDARDLPACIGKKFDVVVTSPPYANRMSYIRELRPYMYWLDYLANGRDAAELDWLAIGGTWGVATSRLAGWSPSGEQWLPDDLPSVLSDIAHGDNANGALLSNYVAKYCEDMSAHFASLRHVLNPGARIHYIVGNSTFYGVLVPTEQIYAGMLREYGFTDIDVRPIRKRNSKKELIEFDVSAAWPGMGAPA